MSARRGTRPTATIRRSTGSTRRPSRIRRASAGFNRTRSLALLGIILAGLALYGASASAAFSYRRLELLGASVTSESIVRQELAVTGGTNLFRLTTEGMADRLRSLPTVADASIEVALPDTIRVRLSERRPIVVWQVGGRRFLVDADRVVFAEADGPSDLPLIDDKRGAISAGRDLTAPDESTRLPQTGIPEIGDTIDPVDFDAATRLGSLRPADVGSGAAAIRVTIDDEHGFSLDSGPDGWTAVFGFYTPTIRRTDLIPGQVRLLASLLAGREATVATVTLADDRNGTYTLKPAP
jgi:POTRA domain, FtsQ-type